MDYTPLLAIRELAFKHGIKNVVHSPGSRSAPLILTFASDKRFKIETCIDERSAAFTAIGIAQKIKSPVILICTSGTATLNFSPAICEAFYNCVPLLILTADRPKYLIDKRDGQTINQIDIYKNFSKGFFNFPIIKNNSTKAFLNIFSNALELSLSKPFGPVHLNFPFEEPFYPNSETDLKLKKNIILPNIKINNVSDDFDFVIEEIKKSKNTLLLAGQHEYDKELFNILNNLTLKNNLFILSDITSNLNGMSNLINYTDLILMNNKLKFEKIDLLISFGKSVLSKNLKNYLRKNKPLKHFHFEETLNTYDTFNSITKKVNLNPKIFFKSMFASEIKIKSDNNWIKQNKLISEKLKNYNFSNSSEINFSKIITESLPKNCNLHLSSSMPIRWVNFIGINKRDIEVFSNRGVSGIDGVLSCAIGSAKVSKKTEVLVVGDLAFQYDRNAFLQNNLPSNLRVIIFNNSGGGIFEIIPGPSNIKKYLKYFTSPIKTNAESIAKDFNISYFKVTNENELNKILKTFYKESDKMKILEIFTSRNKLRNDFINFKKYITYEK